MVAWQLWDRVIRYGSKERISSALGLDREAAGRWIAFWAGAMTSAKLHPAFSVQPDAVSQNYLDARAAQQACGLDFPGFPNPPRHGTISTAILAKMLTLSEPWAELNADFARRVAITVGGHHGVFPASGSWDFGADVLGGPAWNAARTAILNRLSDAVDIDKVKRPQTPPEDAHWFFMILAGLTSVADWIGSNRSFFVPRPKTRDLAKYAIEAREQASRALDDLGWTGWEPDGTGPRTFEELFTFSPRGAQKAAVAIASQLDRPAFVLIEAPTGEGKTEAALCLADHWTHAAGQRGLYVALPTMATSNQMFERVRAFLARRYPDQKVNLHLLHGQALLSKDYTEMQREAERQRQAFAPAVVYDDDRSSGAVVAESWFAQNKKQGLLAPFAVGTIDQTLLAVLQTKHFFVRLFGLAGKTVVLDEVHAYDTYMSSILDRLLEWLSALGCSVVLLSATLPKVRRRALLEAWSGTKLSDQATDYPRVTMISGDRVEAQHVEAAADRQTTLVLDWRDPEKLTVDLCDALRGGGCAAVICNTVGKAQTVFTALRNALCPHGIDVDLFHARFPFGQRQSIEQTVLRRYGKTKDDIVNAEKVITTAPHRPSKAVLVATQVIEQSLDLDFDLMVSEVAPVDLILQRAGRLHRHRRTRPNSLPTPSVWLMQPKTIDGIPRFGNDEYIYEPYVLLRSYLALRARQIVQVPDELERLIEAVYGDDSDGFATAPDEAWERALADSLAAKNRHCMEDQATARGVVIESARFEDDILEVFNMQLEEDDNPEIHRTIQAATRLAEPSVSVVLLYRTAIGLSLSPRGDSIVPLDKMPSLADARLLLGNSVTLQHRGCVGHFIRQPTPEKWRDSGLLRFYRIAELDEAGCCSIGGFILRLDADFGVVIERESKNGGAAP